MPRAKGAGRSLYVGRTAVIAQKLAASDWEDIERDSGLRISPKLRDRLDRIIAALHKHGPDTLKFASAKDVNEKVSSWIRRTNKLRANLSGKKKIAAPVITKRDSIDRIVERYFDPARYTKARLQSADLDYLLEGMTKLVFRVQPRLDSSADLRVDLLDFWLIWAALLISALRKHKVPFGLKTKAGKTLETVSPRSHRVHLLPAIEIASMVLGAETVHIDKEGVEASFAAGKIVSHSCVEKSFAALEFGSVRYFGNIPQSTSPAKGRFLRS